MKRALAIAAILLSATGVVRAGGGGHNMALMVNPDDENSLRVANAYQQIRDIPDCNFLFNSPNAQNQGFIPVLGISGSSCGADLAPILVAFINNAGLHNQINYIGVLGQPPTSSYTNSSVGWYGRSLGCDLMHADEYAAGADPYAFYFTNSPLCDYRIWWSNNYTIGTNTAISHTATTPGYYMAGLVGWTGQFGNSANDVIAGLQRSAAADGTRPAGTVYFEDSNDVRAQTRRDLWTIASGYLGLQGISRLSEFGVSGYTPLNRSNVLGAVVGASYPELPNGSTYLAGSWADSLTSYAGAFSTRSQRKCTNFIKAGAAASSGTVVEPYAMASRFPHPCIHVLSADGSTLGEAYAKSVQLPDLLLFIGDLLAQPYADMPTVTITSGPAEGTTVSGTIQLGASASLSNPRLATAIAKLQLCIDGKIKSEIAGATGQFTIDTTTLGDGWREFRVVAINNAAAQSQKHVLRKLIVSNLGRTVNAGGNVQAAYNQIVPICVQAAGSGTVSRIELRHLGRVLGEIGAASGTISLDAAKLAYGDNPILPVAIFSDNMSVYGAKFTLTRQTPPLLPGQTPTPTGERRYGIGTEYFIGKGKSQIQDVDFSVTADLKVKHSRIGLGISGQTSLNSDSIDTELEPLAVTAGQIDKLALRFSGRFIASQAGQYEFFPYVTCDSYRLIIDNQTILTFTGTPSNPSWSAWLDTGEHNFTYLTTNVGTDKYDSVLYMRGPDGRNRQMDQSFIYVVGSGFPPVILKQDDYESRTAGAAITTYTADYVNTVNGTSVKVVDNHTVPYGGIKTLWFPYSTAANSQQIVSFGPYTASAMGAYDFDIFVASRTPFDNATWTARIQPVLDSTSLRELEFKFVQSSVGANTWNIAVQGTGLSTPVATGITMNQWHHLTLGLNVSDPADNTSLGGYYWVKVDGQVKAEKVPYLKTQQFNGSITDTKYAYLHNGYGDKISHLDMYLDNFVVRDYIEPWTTATPTLSPNGGTFAAETVQVGVDCTTPNATIRYTTDNSTPTGSSAVYSGPITLATSTTLKVQAWADGLDPSVIVTAAYSVPLGDLTAVLAAMDSVTGNPNWNAAVDRDNDGEITSADLANILANMP